MKLDAANTWSARYEVLRDGAVYAEIHTADQSAEVQFVGSSELKMSFRGRFYEYHRGIDFLTDRLRPVVAVNGQDYPCGVYCITTETEMRAEGLVTYEIEGYSLLELARRKKTESRVHLSAGVNYITAVVELLSGCGLSNFETVQTEYTLSADREDWEIGTPVLQIVNELLEEINYRQAWVDLSGSVCLTPYEVPSVDAIDHTYSEGEYSMIESGYTRTTDRYGKANVFRVVCDSPDLAEPMVAVAENNSDGSPFSIARMGRILYTENVDGTPSQEALQARADRLRDESMQITEEAEYYTAPVPEHNAHDVVGLAVGDLTGIYTETEWRLSMSAGASMYHKARRVYA